MRYHTERRRKGKISNGWKLQTVARYLRENGESSAINIVKHAKNKRGRSIDLTTNSLTNRMKKHPSFYDRVPKMGDPLYNRRNPQNKVWGVYDTEEVFGENGWVKL